MAEKRRIDVREDHGRKDEEELDGQAEDQSFKSWVRKEYARYWYWLLFFAIDGFTASYIASVGGAGSAITVVLFLILAFTGEVLLYRRIWSRDDSDG